jgi:hypothetical protein
MKVWELTAKPGDKVVCSSRYTNSWGNCHQVVDYVPIGTICTIEKIEVHSWHTKVWFKEFPNKWFNSIHFKPEGL